MFRQRLITALVLIPLVLSILFYAPFILLQGFLWLLVLACGWEWLQLIPCKKMMHKSVFLGLLVIASCLCSLFYIPWLILGLMVWVLIVFAEGVFPALQRYWGHGWVIASCGLLLLPLLAQSMIQVYLDPEGKALLLYMFLLIWAADIGAYLAGRLWGRHKLIPLVSPGKSWEGVCGGLVCALGIAGLGYGYFHPDAPGQWFIFAFMMVFISIIGDLLISMLKRRVGLKDTGAILPGHGGILDRLDSLIAASPLFYFGLTIFSFGL